jgi:hypothetical protein
MAENRSILELPELPEPDFEKAYLPASVQEDTEEESWTGRYPLPAIVQKGTDYTDQKLDQPALIDVSIDTDPATNRLRLNETTKNLSTGEEHATHTAIGEATAIANGLQSMESAAYTIFCLTKQTLTSVSNIPTTAANTYIEIAAAATVSFTGLANLKPGYRMHVRVKNTGAGGILVTLPGEAPIELDSYSPVYCGAGKVIEFTLWCYAEGKYSLRHYVHRSNIVLSPNVITVNANGS